MWVGLDGDGTQDLVLVGTAQNATARSCNSRRVCDFGIAAYYACKQALPNQRSEEVLANVPVSPGDTVYVTVSWLNNGQGWQGIYGAISIDNLNGKFTQLPIRISVAPAMASAEWILERPQVITYFNGAPISAHLADLADYGKINANGSFLAYGNFFWNVSEFITMYNGNNELSVFSTTGGPTNLPETFTWKNFH
jgi:hypothetical protein